MASLEKLIEVQPGTAANDLGKAEDQAHASGDVGVEILAVRKATPANLSGADGDYEPLQISAGRLWASATIDAAIPAGTNNIGDVDVLSVPAPLNLTGGGVEASALRVTLANDSTGVLSIDDNAGSLTVDGTVTANAGTNLNTSALSLETTQGAVKTAVELLDDAIKTDDAAFTPATDKVLMIGAEADETTPDSVNEGDAGALRMTLARALHVNIRDDAGDSAMDGTNNALRVNVVAGGAGDGAILDGVSAGIKATVLDYTNSNPLAVRLTDTSGDYVGAGAGTQYTVDAAAPASPVGTALVAERDDQLSALTEIEGDWTNARATSKGALWVAIPDSNGDPITSFGGGTQYTEDAASAADPVGNQVLARRRDTLSTETTTDGDVTALNSTGKGELYVKHVDAIPVTDNAGSLTVDAADLDIRNLATGQDKVDVRVRNAADSGFVEPATLGEQQTQTTALQLVDDVVHSGDAVVSKYALIGAVLDDTSPGTVTENQAQSLRMTSARALHVSVRDAIPAGTNNIGDVDVLSLPALPAGANNIGDVDILSIAAGDNNIGNVDVVTMPNVTLAAGTNTNEVVGDIAHDTGVGGNPVLIGAYAETPEDTAPGNQVSAEADVVRFSADRDGAVYTHPHPPRIWDTANEYTSQQTDATIKAAPGAGLSLYITDITIICNAAVTVTLEEDDTADVLKFRYYASGQGDGVHASFSVPKKLTANKGLIITTSAAVTVFVSVNGYTAP